jgi:hypothetical protein
MFEYLIKEMNRLDMQSVSIEIETDEKGYIDNNNQMGSDVTKL